MTEIQKINAAAQAEFDKGNYPSAFQTLWGVGVFNFVSYAQKEVSKSKKTNWFTDSKSANFFWEKFLIDGNIFNSIFKTDTGKELLHIYFFKYKKQVNLLEVKLSKEFPQVFIQAVRVNQVFLNPERIENLKAIKSGNEFQLHQKIWQRIFEIEMQHWNAIQAEVQSVMNFSLEDILSHCIIWLETNRFHDSSQRRITHLASVYSFFIEMVLSNKSYKEVQVKNSDEFFKQFFKIFATSSRDKSIIESGSVAKLLFKISNWINFKELVISPYSFDLNIEPIQQNELVLFNSTPVEFYRWILNGVRYEVNQLKYNLQGSSFSEYIEKEGLTKIPGKTKRDIELNRQLSGLKWATLLMLNDIGYESFKIGNTNIDCEKLLSPLLTYSFNRLSRYENSLNLHFESSKNWSEAFMKLTSHSIQTDISREPYFLMTESEYKKLNQEALSQLPEDSSNEVIQLFRFNIRHEFNRFKYQYDVWQKPFMKIGDLLFCPMMFFARNIWFYSFAQAALSQNTERSQTQRMEKHLGELFRHKNWKVKVANDNDANSMIGDVDIFVEDESTLLLIQLKQTYFRLNLKDAYYESCNIDAKAAKQLNEAESHLSQSNQVYSIKHKPYKWIVSTSFESIGKNINGCYKFNYFELLNALKNPETKSLKDLVKAMQEDKNMKVVISTAVQTDLPNEVRQLFAEVIKPLATFESNQYRQIIFSDDEKRTTEYNSIFDKAVELDNKGKKKDALVEFQKCISLNPNDAEAYGAIANIFADMRVYDSSFIAFKEALKILPNDPNITRNFCLALMESGNWYDGLLKAVELYEKYPMLGDIKILCRKHFEQCTKHGLLNSQQLLELKTKWDNIN